MSGVEPQIRLGSEPRRTERPSADVAAGGRPAFEEGAFVERALAILARQDRPGVASAPVPALPILSQAAPSAAAMASSFLPQAVPPFAPSSLAPALPAAPPPGPTAAAGPPVGLPPSIDLLRKQAVDWIDSLLALVTAGVSPTPVTTNRVAVGAGDEGRGGSSAAAAPPTFPLPAPAPAALPALAAYAGQIVAATLRIANDGAVEAPLRFIASDLVGDSGVRIPASAVSFAPAAAMVAAHAVRALDVFVAIPAGTPAGAYAGLLQLIGQPLARSLLAVDVKPAPARGQSSTEPAPGARV